LQAVEILLKRGLDGCAISSDGQRQEPIGRDATISGVLDHPANGVAQWISLRTGGQGDKAFGEERFAPILKGSAFAT